MCYEVFLLIKISAIVLLYLGCYQMISLKLISWNIRGMNNSVAKRNLQDLVRTNKVDIVCVQETKCEDKLVLENRPPLRQDFYGMAAQPSVGLSGGVATFWYLNSVKCMAIAQTRHWVWTTFRTIVGNGERFHVINIYSPLSSTMKKELL